jgi:putative membrane protein
MGLYYQVKDVFEEEANRLAEESYQTLESMSYELYFWLFIFILIFSVFISFSRILLRFYNFKLTKTEAAFKIQFGLLNTKELSVPLSKIQLISWHKNPLRNWLNYQTLKIKQASSTERIKKLPSIEIPACKWSHREIIERELFGTQEILFSNQYKTHSLYFLRSFLVASILFLLPSIGFLWHEFYYWIAFIVFELFMLVMLILAYQKRYFRISESQIEISKGKVAQTIYRLPNFKIQSLAFEQNIFTKKRALASIVIYTASGENLTIPYISEKLALDLYNFLLYKIESTEQNWM